MKTLEKPLLHPKIVVLGDSNTYVMSVVNQLIGTQIPGNSSLVVPLIINLERGTSDESKSHYIIRYDAGDNQHVETKSAENNLSEELQKAAKIMSSKHSDLFKKPITLCIYQNYISNLTIVIPTPVNISNDIELQEKERKHLEEFLKTNHCRGECVYLNVTSVAKDLDMHESTKVLAEFDQSGKRTISVVTYDDKCSEDSLLRFTSIIHAKKPLGYVLIILKAGFDTHIKEENPLIDYVKAKCYGYESLSKNVVKVMLASTLGPILKRVNVDLEICSHAKKDLKKKFETIGEACEIFLTIVDSSQQSLDNLMIGKIYREYREDVKMHTSFRLMAQFLALQTTFNCNKINTSGTFLEDEFEMLDDGKWSLPTNIMSSDAFHALLEKQFNFVTEPLNKFLDNLWDVIEWTVKRVVCDHAKEHNELRGDLLQCVEISIETARSSYEQKVQDYIALEKSFPFILYVEAFDKSWKDYKSFKSVIVDFKDQDWFKIDDFNINVGKSKKEYPREWSNETWERAFDLKMYVTAYWDVLSERLVNQFAINLLSTLKDLVTTGMRSTMTKYITMKKDTKLMEEEPEVALDRVNLQKREEYLGALKK